MASRFGDPSSFTEESVRRQMDLAAAIGSELFIVDACWWAQQGDWEPSRDRFPNGLKPLVEYAHGKGMLFGLYAEIEKANPGSRVAREHPDWVAWHKPYAVLDLTRPEVAAYMEGEICKLVDRVGIDLFRLDFNTPAQERLEGRECGPGRHRREPVLALLRCLPRSVRAHPAEIPPAHSAAGGLRRRAERPARRLAVP